MPDIEKLTWARDGGSWVRIRAIKTYGKNSQPSQVAIIRQPDTEMPLVEITCPLSCVVIQQILELVAESPWREQEVVES